MKKLTEDQAKQLSSLIDDLRAENDHVEEILTKVNEFINNELNGAIDAYNAKVEEAKQFVGGITDKMEEYVEGKSEIWGDSDTGVAYSDWMGEWSGIDLDLLAKAEFITLDDVTHADDLENLPAEY